MEGIHITENLHIDRNSDDRNEKNIHKGHRERVKANFLKKGFDHNTPPHEILELLLFYCIGRKDTNETAHMLIKKFGSLSGVLDAPVSELITFPDITENNVGLLKMIMPIARVYQYEKQMATRHLKGIDDIGVFLLHEYLGIINEQVSILCLNSNGKVLAFDFISEGDPSSVGISTRDIVKMAIDTGSTCVVLAHNHPSGIALPSRADVEITCLVANALAHINVHLLDHIIIADGDFVSMQSSAEYKEIFAI